MVAGTAANAGKHSTVWLPWIAVGTVTQWAFVVWMVIGDDLLLKTDIGCWPTSHTSSAPACWLTGTATLESLGQLARW
jgi:hypothetical protein